MIEVSHQHPRARFSKRETFRAVSSVLSTESQRAPTLSIVFADNRFIRRINKRFLRNGRATDVIAFSLGEGKSIDGEIYVNLDRARVQAEEYHVPFRREVQRLLIHGTLHLLGYRDASVAQQRRMTRREDFYLARLESGKKRNVRTRR